MAQSKPIIGLCGGVGAGKSLVAHEFARLGGLVIDSDQLNHQVLRRPEVAQALREWWGDEILSEAFAGPSVRGVVEIGVIVRKEHLRRGSGTIACVHLIRACEDLGYQTYWNCAKQNLASAGLARKLGYRTEREYKLVAWFRSNLP